MQKSLTYLSRFLYGIAFLVFVVWTLRTLGYCILVIIPDDTFEPVTGLIALVLGYLLHQLSKFPQPSKSSILTDSPLINLYLRQEWLTILTNRYKRRLEDTLARLALGLKATPDAVTPVWHKHIPLVRRGHEIPPGTPIEEIFDQS